MKPAFEKTKVYEEAADGTKSGIRPRLEASRAAFVLAENAYNDARDAYVALQWEQHDWVMGAREQIAAKHGKSSDQYAATGRKKKSEYKKGGPKGPTKNSTKPA